MERLRCLIKAETIAQRVKELGKAISNDYQGEEVIFIGILKGAFVFMADLIREVSLELKIDFIRLSSYGDREASSGQIKITKDIELTLRGKNILIVEDIIDTGYTLKFLLEYFKKYHPKDIKICCLIDKAERRKIDLPLDYVGFKIPQGFLVGYGLDYAEKYRSLPAIYEIIKE